MKRITLLAVACALLAACGAENRTTIEVLGRAAPSDSIKCTFIPGGMYAMPSEPYDVGVAGPFALALYVQNNLVDPSKLNPASITDSNSWSVQAVRVRVNPSSYTNQFKPSPALASITGDSVIPVGSSPVVKPAGGQGVIFLSSLLTDGAQTALQGAAAGGQIVLGITLQGHTGDGARLDTGEFFFPVDIVSNKFVACGSLSCPSGTIEARKCDGQTDVCLCQ